MINLRCIFCICSIIANIISIITWEEFRKQKWYYHFFYYTNWTLILGVIYFYIKCENKDQVNEKSPFFWEIFIEISVLVSSIVVMYIYWIFIYPRECNKSKKFYYIQILVHTIIPLLIIYDTLIVSKTKYTNIIYALIFPFIYCIFMIYFYKKTHIWLYTNELNLLQPEICVFYYLNFIAVYMIISYIKTKILNI